MSRRGSLCSSLADFFSGVFISCLFEIAFAVGKGTQQVLFPFLHAARNVMVHEASRRENGWR